jgi:hypothetical protein
MTRKLIALPVILAGMGLVGHLRVNVPERVHMGVLRPIQQLLDLLPQTVLPAMLVDMALEGHHLPNALVTAALAATA